MISNPPHCLRPSHVLPPPTSPPFAFPLTSRLQDTFYGLILPSDGFPTATLSPFHFSAFSSRRRVPFRLSSQPLPFSRRLPKRQPPICPTSLQPTPSQTPAPPVFPNSNPPDDFSQPSSQIPVKHSPHHSSCFFSSLAQPSSVQISYPRSLPAMTTSSPSLMPSFSLNIGGIVNLPCGDISWSWVFDAILRDRRRSTSSFSKSGVSVSALLRITAHVFCENNARHPSGMQYKTISFSP